MKVIVYGTEHMPWVFEDIDEVRWSAQASPMGLLRAPFDVRALVIPTGTMVYIDGRQVDPDDVSTLPVMEPVSAV